MKITVEIPSNVADFLDPVLRSMEGERLEREDGSTLITKQYPNGIEDWVATIVQQNLEQIVSQIPNPPPAIQAIKKDRQQLELALRERMAQALRPTVTLDEKE